MPEAILTRDAAGMDTLTHSVAGKRVGVSVADLPNTFGVGIKIQIGGPPCQTYSPAGNGAGRLALGRVLAGVDVVARGERFRPTDGDPRTWLVLEPLRLALHGRPEYIVWEQVGSVLPVWEACGEVLASAHGYSVATGLIQAEQYGVPQSRKRAILIARLDGRAAAFPTPTHSAYYPSSPSKLDPDVKPWVSMEEALGWRPGSVTTGQQWIEAGALVRQERSTGLPAPTVTGNTGAWAMRSNYGSGGDPANRGIRQLDQPAPTVTGKIGRNKWVLDTRENPDRTRPRPVDEPARTIKSSRAGNLSWQRDGERIPVTVAEAAVLQTLPVDHPFAGGSGKKFLQIGNAVPPLLAETILSTFID